MPNGGTGSNMESTMHQRTETDGLERMLQLLTIGLAVLSAFLVDWGRGRAAFSPALLVTSLTAFYVTDTRRWIQLPRAVVGILTLGVVFPMAQGFLRYDTAAQLTEIGRLLTVWISVFFFQAKSPRIYGSLIVLSLLMVVVASILNDGLVFALLLIVFQFGGLLSLILLYVHSGQIALRSRFAAAVGAGRAGADRASRLADRLLGKPILAYQEPSSLPDRGRMWDRGLIVHLLGMVCATIVFTAAFFFAVPRIGAGGWRAMRERPHPSVGLGSAIEFRQFEKILSNDELVLRLAFSDARTGAPLPAMLGPVYLQGRALPFYDVDARGHVTWRSYSHGEGAAFSELPRSTAEPVRTDFLFEPTGDPSLVFISAPASGPGTPGDLRYDRHSGRLVRPRSDDLSMGTPYRYSLYSDGFRSRSQMPVMPVRNHNRRTGETEYQLGPQEKAGLLEFDRARFPRLAQTARALIEEGRTETNRIFKGRALQNHLKDARVFHYTLDLESIEAVRHPELDPIEDFVANHHTGHCAYFASALAMMLRSVGIPARVVIGFLDGEYNGLGNYYQFRQNDAHAWVEMYLEPDQVPEGPTAAAVSPGGAAWYRLDPTPPADDALVGAEGARNIDKLLDFAQLLWKDYVLDMNAARQNASGIFSPPGERAGLLERTPFLGPVWSAMRSWWKERIVPFLAAWRREGFWNWRGGVVASVLAALVFALAAAARFAARSGRAFWSGDGRRGRAAGPRIEFYERLERILRHHGWVRRPTQTQREFAREASAAFHEGHGDASVDALRRIIDAFYRVRFGGATLSDTESREIDGAVDSVRAHVASRPR